MKSVLPLASLSLDLDNRWSYMKTHGDAGWEQYPSYLKIVVPRVLDLFHVRNWKITWFIVGLDAALAEDREVLRQITEQGHEVGNHSYHHEPWLHLYSEEEIEAELARTEAAIEEVTGVRPKGFRGPGFSFSSTVLKVLDRRGYEYDCSTFPTFLGPLARMYYLAKSQGLSDEERQKRSQLFGKFSEGFRPLKPYRWGPEAQHLLEIPVTTMPLFKIPIHLSYLLYLGGISPLLARFYWHIALTLCRLTRTNLSLLLHPLDFMGQEDQVGLEFFPAMKQSLKPKLKLVNQLFDILGRYFQVVPMGVHADSLNKSKPISEALLTC